MLIRFTILLQPENNIKGGQVSSNIANNITMIMMRRYDVPIQKIITQQIHNTNRMENTSLQWIVGHISCVT